MSEILYPINEYFLSIQGEGTHTGKLAFFIRFGQCNLRCKFCDSKDTWTNYKYQKHTTLLKKLQRIKGKTNFLILTGGEPTIHNLYFLIKDAKKLGFYIAVETNGIENPDWLNMIDWLTISPKTKISKTMLQKANELKFVITDKKSWKFMLNFMPFSPTYLMPVDNNKKVANKIVKWISNSPYSNILKLGIQLHKVYNFK